jgi:hypothetical protein
VASAFSLMAKHSTEPTALAAGLCIQPFEGPEAIAYGSAISPTETSASSLADRRPEVDAEPAFLASSCVARLSQTSGDLQRSPCDPRLGQPSRHVQCRSRSADHREQLIDRHRIQPAVVYCRLPPVRATLLTRSSTLSSRLSRPIGCGLTWNDKGVFLD